MDEDSGISGLFVGIKNYFKPDGGVDTERSLIAAPGDAIRLKSSFAKLSNSEMFNLLTDNEDSLLRPTKNNFFILLNEVLEKKKEKSNIVIYFAGHGSTVNNDFLLHPCDYDSRIPDISSIKINELLQKISIIRGKKLIICDSCRKIIDEASTLRDEGNNKMPPFLVDENTFILFACSDNQYSFETLDLAENPAGVFSFFLSDTIEKNIFERDKNGVSLYKIFEETKKKTIKYISNKIGSKQIPTLQGGDANDWILLR